MNIFKCYFSYLYLVNDKSPKVMQDDKTKSSLQESHILKKKKKSICVGHVFIHNGNIYNVS